MIALFEDATGKPADAADAEAYWKEVDEPDFPVTSDPDASVFDVTPFNGSPLPGKCVLSPEMEMLACEAGQDEDDWAFDIIREHAGL